MTSTVTSASTDYLAHITFGSLSTTIGLLAIASLILLLLVREIISAVRGDQAVRESRALDIVTGPLLFVFAIVIVGRLLDLLK